jgi:hypothetical protein
MGGGSDVTVRWLRPVARGRKMPTVPQGGEFRLTADNVPLRGSLPRHAAGFWLAGWLPIITYNALYKADRNPPPAGHRSSMRPTDWGLNNSRAQVGRRRSVSQPFLSTSDPERSTAGRYLVGASSTVAGPRLRFTMRGGAIPLP